MFDQWKGKNVDLTALSHKIEEFLAENEYETLSEERSQEFRINASTDKYPTVLLKILVRIVGRPDDFKLEFVPNRKTRGFSPSMIGAYIAAAFGGGTFLLRDVKIQELLNEFEQAFWKRVDELVAELSASATAQATGETEDVKS